VPLLQKPHNTARRKRSYVISSRAPIGAQRARCIRQLVTYAPGYRSSIRHAFRASLAGLGGWGWSPMYPRQPLLSGQNFRSVREVSEPLVTA
jgi:hypothetical protein